MNTLLGRLSSVARPRARAGSHYGKLGDLPGLTARCGTVDEVRTVVRLAADAGKRVRMAHDLDVEPGDVLLDISNLCGATMDEPGIMRIAGGSNVRGALAAASAHRRTLVGTPSLDACFADVLTRGGYGPLVGKFGLASDHLLHADIVLPDGDLVRATPEDAPDLLWLLRGGGRRVGVIVSATVEVHAPASVRSAVALWSGDRTRELLDRVALVCSKGPENLTIEVGSVMLPDGREMVYCAPTAVIGDDAAVGAVDDLCGASGAAATPRERSANAACELLHRYAPRTGPILASIRLPSLSDPVKDGIVDILRLRPHRGCGFGLHELFGQASRAPDWSTAFPHRAPHLLFVLRGSCGAEAKPEEREWAREAMARLAPHALAPAQDGRHERRRSAVLRRYDPDGVFGRYHRRHPGSSRDIMSAAA